MTNQIGKSKIRLLAKSTSVSSSPVKPGKTYPLSVLDHAMANHTLHLVFYFPRTTGNGFSISRERIKESFSDMLSYYPTATGRLTRGEEDGNWIVRCNDAGVRVLDVEVDLTMDEWFKIADEEQERGLAYWEEMGQNTYIWSPFYLQISEFKDGGIAIGLSCPHMCADPTCATLLIKAIGDAHRRATIVHPPFFHPPGLKGRPNPNTSTSSVALLQEKFTHPKSSTTTTTTTKTFRFDDHAVKRCLDEISRVCPSATPFDAIAALFWWRIGGEKLNVGVDFRKRLHAPLPHGFFGNAVHFSEVLSGDVGGGEEDEVGRWGNLAEAVRKHVEGLEAEEYLSAIDWFEGRRKENGAYAEAFQMYGPGLTCMKLDHMFTYDTRFDDKGPSYVSYRIGGQVDGDGLILVLPHPDGGDGRTVAVTLPDDRMDEICRDEAILRLGSKLVFPNGGTTFADCCRKSI